MFEHTIIEETVLPSCGLPYGDLLPGGIVKIAPMRTKEEKLLASQHGDKLKVLETIVDRCLLTKVMPLEEYLVADYFYMLLAIRNLSYGPDYSFQLTCPKCTYEFIHRMQVPEGFEMRILPDGNTTMVDGSTPKRFEEPFFCTLPLSKKRVGLKLLRVKDERDIRKFAERLTVPTDVGDPSYEARIAKFIVSIDDKEVDWRETIEFVENLYTRDTGMVKAVIEDNDCGVNLVLEPQCPRCCKRSRSRFQFTEDFFRASRSEGDLS